MLGKGYGLGRYVEQLIENVVCRDSANRYVLFVQEEEYRKRETGNGKRDSLLFVLAHIPWYSWQEQVLFPRILKKEKIDFMHFPHWNVPLLYRKPFVMTVHDLTMFHFPRPEATTLGPLKFWIKDRAHRIVLRSACRRARKIITTSEFTKQDLHNTLGVPYEKMETVYQAPFQNEECGMSRLSGILTPLDGVRPNGGPHTAGKNEELLLYDIVPQKPYVLYVGAAYPHKNVERLIEAWTLVEEAHPDEFQLVLAGREDSFWERRQSAIHDHQSIKYLGLVSDVQLLELYTNARLFVFPSLYEGFGLPPLEAMVHGVPVVSSNSSCLPEVLGEGALYFDPTDIEDMAKKMSLGLTNEDICFVLRQNAKHEVAKFSREQFGEQTLQIYRSVIS